MAPLTGKKKTTKQNFVEQIYLCKNSLIFNMILLNFHEQTTLENIV